LTLIKQIGPILVALRPIYAPMFHNCDNEVTPLFCSSQSAICSHHSTYVVGPPGKVPVQGLAEK
jgi:ABC-type cobalt transport system substrate-binding protein